MRGKGRSLTPSKLPNGHLQNGLFTAASPNYEGENRAFNTVIFAFGKFSDRFELVHVLGAELAFCTQIDNNKDNYKRRPRTIIMRDRT